LSPKLQQQWDHEKNAHLGNIIITFHTARIVSWRCSDCPDGHPHDWEAPVTQRTKSEGCPFCRGRRVCKHNSLVTQAPDVAAAWDNEANASSPDEFTTQSHHRAHWWCPICKHKWCTTIQARVRRSTGCPQCYRSRRHTKHVAHPTFAACHHPLLSDWDYEANAKDGLHPEKVKLRSNKLVHWVCHKCPKVPAQVSSSPQRSHIG